MPESHCGGGGGGSERVGRDASFAELDCQVTRWSTFVSQQCPRLKGVSDFARKEAPCLVAELTEVREPVGGYVRLAEQV